VILGIDLEWAGAVFLTQRAVIVEGATDFFIA
jgi:hypothetical protein